MCIRGRPWNAKHGPGCRHQGQALGWRKPERSAEPVRKAHPDPAPVYVHLDQSVGGIGVDAAHEQQVEVSKEVGLRDGELLADLLDRRAVLGNDPGHYREQPAEALRRAGPAHRDSLCGRLGPSWPARDSSQ